MPIHQVEVGRDLYVFTSRVADRADSWGARPNCIIDCHGYRPATKPKFTAEQFIHFYVDPHATLAVEERLSPGFVDVYHYVSSVAEIADSTRADVRKVEAVETVWPGQKCRDYELAKQVMHNDSTVVRLDPNDRYQQIGYEDLRKYLEKNPHVAAHYDLISIRNRAFGKTMLSGALDTLKKHGYAYTTVHCSFCRGGFVDVIKVKFGRGTEQWAGGANV